MLKRLIIPGLLLQINLLATSVAYASTSSTGLVWEGLLQTIAVSISGPVATSIAIIAAVWAGITLMFNEVNRGVKWVVGIILGFSIATSIIGILGILGLTTTLM